MTLLPIVARELRVASRSKGYYWGRFLAALVSIGYAAYLTFVIVGSSALRNASAGGMLFTSLAWMGLFFCIGSVRTTTDCISEEKREGTLGLLFLTDLKGYDVVLGKLFAHSVRPFYGLMATVPVICCALVMGGLTFATVCMTVLALLNIFFFAQSAGLLVSTLSRDRQRATAASVILLGFFFLMIPGVVELLRAYSLCPRLADTLELFAGARAFSAAQSGLFLVPARSMVMLSAMRYSTYWASLLALHLTGWFFLALASLAVPRSWQDKPVKTKTRWSERMRQWCYGPPEVREALRRHLLEINPFLWLISRNRLGQTMVWATLGFIGCGWVWMWFLTDSDRSDGVGYTVAIAIVNHTFLKFWIAAEAGGQLAEQRRSGALEYLLSCTPLSVDETIRAQWLALRRRFLRPLIFVVVVDLVLLAVSAHLWARRMNNDDYTEFAIVMLAGIIMLLVDAWALGWAAMWQAMIEKKPRTAAGSALVRIVVLPWLIMGFMAPFGFFFESSYAVLAWWFILGIGLDIGFATLSREKLVAEFRTQAAARPEERMGLLGKLGRLLGQMVPRVNARNGMTFLPIVARELLVASRRKRTYSIRFRSALTAAIVGGVMLFILIQIPMVPEAGWATFQVLAWFCFVHCLGLAGNTADCISEEKREGTLGLMFLTDLTGWDVALGKLFANSLQSLYAVIATFPVVAIVLTLGGVSIGQFCKVALALLNVFFFAHTTGLLASVLSRVLSRAHAATGALMLGFLAGPPLLALAINGGQFDAFSLLLAAFSPGYALVQVMLPGGGDFYWFSLVVVHLTAWFFLALASWRLPYCWQEKAGPVRLRWRDRFRQWTYGRPAFREDLRRRLAGINPFLWLVSRNRLTQLVFPAFLTIVGAVSICAWWGTDAGQRYAVVIPVVIIVHSALIGGVAAEACRHLEDQRRAGALEFILCATPLPPEEIIAGQWLALRRLFLRPMKLVLVSEIVVLLVNCTRFVAVDTGDKLMFDLAMSFAMIMLVVDVIAAGYVGMWRAMANRPAQQNVAVSQTVFLLIPVPLGILAGVAAVLDAFDWLPDSPLLPLCLWFILALTIAVVASRMGKRQLETRFREMAVVRTNEPIGIFGLLGRLLGRIFRRRKTN